MRDSHGARRTTAVCGRRVARVDLFCVVVDIRALPKLCGNPPNPTDSRITLGSAARIAVPRLPLHRTSFRTIRHELSFAAFVARLHRVGLPCLCRRCADAASRSGRRACPRIVDAARAARAATFGASRRARRCRGVRHTCIRCRGARLRVSASRHPRHGTTRIAPSQCPASTARGRPTAPPASRERTGRRRVEQRHAVRVALREIPVRATRRSGLTPVAVMPSHDRTCIHTGLDTTPARAFVSDPTERPSPSEPGSRPTSRPADRHPCVRLPGRLRRGLIGDTRNRPVRLVCQRLHAQIDHDVRAHRAVHRVVDLRIEVQAHVA